jgi:hypothetical protein
VSGSIALFSPDAADACGGCFISQSESTQVTGHRMALAVSPTQTTLWDQITYDGDPAEFAWVLPIAGEVDVDLSSDLLFEVLESETQVFIQSPQLNCNTGCPGGGFGSGATGASTGTGMGGVEVIAQEVVGPYETVQLQASDPQALASWLDSHGYNIPDDVQPVVSAYVNEGFGFLAMRLVPGQDIDAMKPVRITSPGASPKLPLRMVAAGTGARTPITLWVVGEGRYEPQNFYAETISGSQLVWNWDTQSSNYATLRQEILDADGGSRWLAEAAEEKGPWVFDQLTGYASADPVGSGYADPMGQGAVEAAQADVETLTAGMSQEVLWITRLSADLSRDALAADLVLQASPSQQPIERFLQVFNEVGTRPECPQPAPCGGDGSGAGVPFDLTQYGVDDDDYERVRKDDCGYAPRGTSSSSLLWVGLAAAAYLATRRRRG